MSSKKLTLCISQINTTASGLELNCILLYFKLRTCVIYLKMHSNYNNVQNNKNNVHANEQIIFVHIENILFVYNYQNRSIVDIIPVF